MSLVPIEKQSLELALDSHFAIFEKQALEWKEKAEAIQVIDESQTELMLEARQTRLVLKAVRVAIVDKHKDLKENSLREGQILDSIKRRLVALITPIEAHLDTQERFTEIREEERKQELRKTREFQLIPYVGDQVGFMQLGEMDEITFNAVLKGQQVAKKEREEKEEADRKEKEIVAENARKDQERIREENERLRKENEAKQQQLTKQKAIADEKLKKERDERLRLEKEAKDKADQEEAERKAKVAADRKLKRAPDKEKLENLSAQIKLLVMPDLKEEESDIILNNVRILLGKVVKYLDEKTESL